MSDVKDQCVRHKRCKRSVNDDVGARIDLSLINSNSNVYIKKEAPTRSTRIICEAAEWDAAWSLLRLADFAPSETIALPRQTSIGDRSSASLQESLSFVNQFTTPNSTMASNSSVQQPLSVNPHQYGQIRVLAPTSNTSYVSSITSSSKPFHYDSIVQVASSSMKNISKPRLVSPLVLVSPQTMVGVSHSKAGKSLNNNAVIADRIISQGSSRSLNIIWGPVKGNSVLSGNMTIAVKNNLSTNSVATCASHSKMTALHVSKAHSQVIQPSLASSIITQGDVASPSYAKASTSNKPKKRTVEKKEVKFSIASIYYFNRTQGFTAVPSEGGCSLGMERNHTHMEILSVENYSKKKIINSQREKSSPVLLSDGNEDSTEESNGLPVCELDVTRKTFKPLTVDERRALLQASGVQKIVASEEKECNFIRSSRQNCGCKCKTTCDPNICSCSNLGIKCQVEFGSFPCGCKHDSCGNPNGRYEYDVNGVQNHFKKL